MTDSNFNWYLHVLLFLHSLHIMTKIQKKNTQNNNENEDPASDIADSDYDPDADELDVTEDQLTVNVSV